MVYGAAVPGEEMFACTYDKRLGQQPEQVQEHNASAMPEEGVFLSEFISRSMNWQPQMSVLCFSGADITATPWRPAKMDVVLCRVVVWVSWSWHRSPLPLGILCLEGGGRPYHGEAPCH